MARLRIQETAKQRDMNMSQLLARINSRLPHDVKPVAMGTMRRYWYSTKDGKEEGPEIELVDLVFLGTISNVLGVRM